MFQHVCQLDRAHLKDSERWVAIANNGLRMFSAGLLGGGAVGFILFRSVAARASLIAFGGGFGAGNAYIDAKYLLGHDTTRVECRLAQVVPTRTGGGGGEAGHR